MKTYTLILKESPTIALMKAKQALKGKGELTGDEFSGEFRGAGLIASYEIKGENLLLKILRKPFLVPESMIVSKIEKFFT